MSGDQSQTRGIMSLDQSQTRDIMSGDQSQTREIMSGDQSQTREIISFPHPVSIPPTKMPPARSWNDRLASNANVNKLPTTTSEEFHPLMCVASARGISVVILTYCHTYLQSYLQLLTYLHSYLQS